MSRKTILYTLKSEKGFMLAEVMLAVLIMSVALVAITGLFTQAILANLMATHYTEAANLAQKQLELLKIHPPQYWAGFTLPIVWQDQTQLPPPRYTLTTNAIPSTIDEHLVQVTVTVAWQERGNPCRLQFVTLYSVL